jgi:rod shape-determining protein MreC
VQRAASSAIGSVRDVWSNYFALQQIRHENEQLREEVSKLRVGLQQERAVAEQTRTLQQLLNLRTATPLTTQAATVIAGGASPEFRTITIDKGTTDGVDSDMAAMRPQARSSSARAPRVCSSAPGPIDCDWITCRARWN